MGKEIEKEPDFYPFRIKDHGWVLKKGVSTETIGEAFKDMVYELVTKDFTPGSIAESMHNDALTMIDERAAKARKAAKTRWQKAQGNQLTADGDTREDSLNMTNGRNAGKLESGTSANLYDQVAYHSISTDEKPAGGQLLPSSSRSPVGKRHASVDVLNLAYAGEFGNVRLTQEQYAQLGIKFGNQQKLNRAIDSLSCQIENGEKNPQNHYAELVKWASYRDDMEERKEEEASKPKMTEMEKSWIEAMKRVEAM